ncbi:Oxidoreductase, iron-sulfur binding subunit [Pseudomonas syringae pv. helianthi]|uniref:Oxidoreductase, iron-sulfur binding subunit n=3 Tax=Pseudomonas syringae group genomosp. 7 TaxID=251699 RepID=A0A0N8RPI1_9PSED|nr:Oxidoreductase, iron-sulfur binding subunit [Pseudomonas syringae pv. helianthi]KPY82457.1 Oxidoreductase, iron-sulfur binding subunit [Pseudomonas syringae pv. tagetis]RMR09364.1 Oxidoreductase, iron-sulfur binding subunit [Pseudomonas syringae pv. helianthi]RMV44683.1 Oxidoreductase, iron-sulfur binding subunit [Pseudomonas syringae pv. helianthi]RMW17748.1 Oxidoreductase, iron-sulfur binding subunit [Pseudomonas syringae pv. tagetis]
MILMSEPKKHKESAVDSSAVQPSRRNFLKFGASGIAAATLSTWIPSEGMLQAAPVAPVVEDSDAPAAGEQRIQLKVNGRVHTLNVPANAVLLDVLRDRLQLTGTKKGCDHGQCGACTLLVNGIAINSCLSIAVQHQGDSITTIEGLAENGTLHPVQEAFWEHDAYQCGYCTSGQIMSAVAILKDPNIPSDDASVREAMSGNICRCGAYKNILSAVQSARSKMGGAA